MRSIVGGARLILLAVVIVILFFLVVGIFPVVPDSMRVRMVKRWAPRLLRVLGIRLDVKSSPCREKEKEALVIFTESTRPGAFSIGTRYIHSPSYFTDGNVPSIT